jgi:hypothetical protein
MGNRTLLIIIFSILSFVKNLHADSASDPPAPWLTGPLIAPAGLVVPYGQLEIEPYTYFTTNTGVYNKHWKPISARQNFFSMVTQLITYFGLSPIIDINIIPQVLYNNVSNQNAIGFGDLIVALDIQLLDPASTQYFPGIKFTLRETFPTGNYQRLDRHKLGTDITGAGTFATDFNLVFYKVYYLGRSHYLSTTYSASYQVCAPVKVHGLNTYGIAPKRGATAYPGSIFQGIVSFELTLTQNWVLALDNVYTRINASKLEHALKTPSSDQISFAPAFEYNFNSNVGVAIGCWFSAWGRNSPIFRSAIIDLVCIF